MSQLKQTTPASGYMPISSYAAKEATRVATRKPPGGHQEATRRATRVATRKQQERLLGLHVVNAAPVLQYPTAEKPSSLQYGDGLGSPFAGKAFDSWILFR